jgi:glycosyltransferase involved in cell wall biosynthesis
VRPRWDVSNIHIYPAPIINESRIFKQTLSIARSGLFTRVIICGTARYGLPRQEDLTCGRRIDRVGSDVAARTSSVSRRIQQQVGWSAMVFKRYSRCSIGVVNAHSVAVLPVCFLLSRRLGAKLIYDTHELETETSSSRGLQGKIYKVIERLLIPKCDAVFVVSESIAEWYRARYPFLRPEIIRNIPNLESLALPVDLRGSLSIPADKRLFIHVGHLAGGRNIPTILEAFASEAVDAHIVFLGGGQLEALVREYCLIYPNIHLVRPVAPADVVSYVAGCDVGLCLIEPSCLSYKMSLPNKAFEYIKGGAPFFFTDLPEIDRLLGPTFAGWRISDPDRDLTREIANLAASTVEGAKAELAALHVPTWDQEATAMIAAYVRLISPAEALGAPIGERS